MRTNVIIDDQLMDAALKASGLKSKTAVIETGLKLLIQFSRQKDLGECRGKLKWQDDLNEMRLDP